MYRVLHARINRISLAYLQNCYRVYHESCVSPGLLQRFPKAKTSCRTISYSRAETTLSRCATNAMASKQHSAPPGMVAVRWDMPGSKYDGVVHFVSNSLVDELGGGRVAVWWPNRSKGKRWEGQLAGKSINLPYFTTSLYALGMIKSCCVLCIFRKQVHCRHYSRETA